MAALTKRQKDVHDFLVEFINKHGYSPSIKEICEHFGTTSLGTMQKLLTTLENKGLIRRVPNKQRSIELAEESKKEVIQHEIPVMGYLAENSPIEVTDVVRFLKMPDEITVGRYTYIINVKGDFLSGENISDGDYLIIESRSSVADREMALVLMGKRHVTLRRISRDGAKLVLRPTKLGMKTEVVDEKSVKILGALIGVFRNYLKSNKS